MTRIEPKVVRPHPPILTRDYLLLMGATGSVFISMQMLMPGMPLYVLSLGIPPQLVGLLLGVFAISAVAVRPLVGRLIDAWGRVVVLRAGAVMFFFAPFLYVLSKDPWQMSAARIWHGMAFATCVTAAGTLAADLAPLERRGEALGVYGMSSRLSTILAPALGMYLLDRGGFSLLFIAAALVLLGAVLGGVLITEPGVRASVRGHSSYKSLLGRRSVLGSLLALLPVSISWGAVLIFLPLLARDRGALSLGWLFTSLNLSMTVAMFCMGRVSDHIGRRPLIVPGLGLVGLSAFAFAGAEGFFIFVTAVVFGLGFGIVNVATNALLVDSVPRGDRGAAMALYSATLDTGIFLGSAALGYFLGGDLYYVFSVAGGICFLGILAYLLQEKRK